jgi:metal-responsive CopG/Arc/MetJ family transcriptional regulator
MKKTKIIQVPMPPDLVQELDAEAGRRGESRAYVIREAVVEYIASSQNAKHIQQDIEGYTRFPESDEDSEWRIRNAGDVWGEEDWDEDSL